MYIKYGVYIIHTEFMYCCNHIYVGESGFLNTYFYMDTGDLILVL